MPTGYTAAIESGEISTLKQFALQCARGMGACITMRDTAWDTPIPERFEPSTKYSEDRLFQARALLAEVDTLTDEECDARAKASFEAALERHNQYEAERKIRNERHRAMLEKVRNWHTEAEGIRDFMIEQLTISIDKHVGLEPLETSGAEWRTDTRREALRDIHYHEKSIADEIHRVTLRNQWLADLRLSLENVDG
ncbi:hypothetical protein [Neorhizobium sp. DAR64861/K0K2]|uniref:hypothetical protein n=1 Tax=unclassified Neorhizobium TaxID=2629175 RepID=UPI003D2E61E6